MNVVKWLVEECGYSGYTSSQFLVAACESSNMDLIKWLASKGEGITKDIFCNACPRSSLSVVQFLYGELLKKESLPTERLEFTFAFTCRTGNMEVAKWLHSLGVKVTRLAFLNCCIRGDLESAKWIYEIESHIIDRTTCDKNEEIKCLEKTFIDVKTYNIIFSKVCYLGFTELAKWLMTVSMVNLDEAFLEACRGNRLDTAKWLVEQGVNIRVWGITALRMAQGQGQKKIVDWLNDTL